MKIANDNPKLSFLLPFCHSCSPSVIPAKAGIQSWFLWRVRRKRQRHWIHSLTGSPIRRRGQASRMTEGEMSRMTEGKEGEGVGDYRSFRSARAVTGM